MAGGDGAAAKSNLSNAESKQKAKVVKKANIPKAGNKTQRQSSQRDVGALVHKDKSSEAELRAFNQDYDLSRGGKNATQRVQLKKAVKNLNVSRPRSQIEPTESDDTDNAYNYPISSSQNPTQNS